MELPSVLIQVHYHDRPGGVCRVIGEYARAFRELTGADSTRNIVVWASRDSATSIAGVRVHQVSGCDYRNFASAESFVKVRDGLAADLAHIIDNAASHGRVCVVGHNLTLGKNPALSSAFAALARRYDACTRDIRFLSVVHDMVEHGRVRLVRGLDRITRMGIPIWEDLYPSSRNFSFVSVNSATGRVLRSAGLACRYLPNPLEPPGCRLAPTPRQRRSIGRALRELAARDGTRYLPARRTVFLPGRITARKNVPEAIVLACILLRANLITGSCGAAHEDLRLMNCLKRVCRAGHVPVVFDVDRLGGMLDVPVADVFPLLYSYTDACISCSVDEGFGYSLREPWLHGVPVIGRQPLTLGRFAASHLLYRTFPFPQEWIPVGRLAARYARNLRDIRSADPPANAALRDLLVQDGLVDFGALDCGTQLELLPGLLAKPGGALCGLLPNDVFYKQKHFLEMKNAPEVLRQMAAIGSEIARSGAWGLFLTRFRKCLTGSSDPRRRIPRDPSRIRHRCGRFRSFRLLMGGG